MSVEIVIQCATPLEFEALRQIYRAQKIEREGKRQYFSVGSILVFKAGLGKALAAAGAEFALSKWKPKVLLDFGTCGAVGIGLRVGDLIFADKVVEHDHLPVKGRSYSLNPDGFKDLFKDVPVYPEFIDVSSDLRITQGCIASGDKDIESVVERSELAKKHSAIAVTWESSAVGRVCEMHKTSFAVIRVVSDVGTQALLDEYKSNASRVLGIALKYLIQKLPDHR